MAFNKEERKIWETTQELMNKGGDAAKALAAFTTDQLLAVADKLRSMSGTKDHQAAGILSREADRRDGHGKRLWSFAIAIGSGLVVALAARYLIG